jgi:hypothetical protein
MSDKSLQLSEQALRLGLAVLALGLAAWLAGPQAVSPNLAQGPKPTAVMEW